MTDLDQPLAFKIFHHVAAPKRCWVENQTPATVFKLNEVGRIRYDDETVGHDGKLVSVPRHVALAAEECDDLLWQP